MKNSNLKRAVLQNLKDAGCDRQTVEEFFTLEDAGSTKEQLKLLSSHRRQLLDQVHEEERKIACLDYLVCQIQKRQKA